MEYELDIDARHLVEWLKADVLSAGTGRFEISATRNFVEEQGVPDSGSSSAEDQVAAMTAVGVLEVRPKLDSSGNWVIRVQVEDMGGPHLPEAGSVPDEPEDMSLEGFETDFLLPDRGTVFATLEVDTEADRERFVSFANELRSDRHPS